MSFKSIMNELLSAVALSVALISVLIGFISLINVISDAPAAAIAIDNLRAWIDTTGYHLALIILATAGTLYLLKKK